jgi:hypothetical protein
LMVDRVRCGPGYRARGYCGRRVAEVVGFWSLVTCKNCLAARAADSGLA